MADEQRGTRRQRARHVGNAIWKDLPCWFVIIGAITSLTQIALFYHHPQHGFGEFGPAVFLAALFPASWALLYSLGKRRENAASPATRGTGEGP